MFRWKATFLFYEHGIISDCCCKCLHLDNSSLSVRAYTWNLLGNMYKLMTWLSSWACVMHSALKTQLFWPICYLYDVAMSFKQKEHMFYFFRCIIATWEIWNKTSILAMFVTKKWMVALMPFLATVVSQATAVTYIVLWYFFCSSELYSGFQILKLTFHVVVFCYSGHQIVKVPQRRALLLCLQFFICVPCGVVLSPLSKLRAYVIVYM